jgi:hypothetical protein
MLIFFAPWTRTKNANSPFLYADLFRLILAAKKNFFWEHSDQKLFWGITPNCFFPEIFSP